MKTYINLSMISDNPTGVGIYCKKIYDEFRKSNISSLKYLFLKQKKFVTVKRIFWNLFIMPIMTRGKLVYSLSTHGSFLKKNQIVTIHDLISIKFPKQYRFQYYYFKYYVPLLIRSSKYIVAISNFTKSEVVDYYKINPDKVKVIYNGVEKLDDTNSEAVKSEIKELVSDCPYFICIGASFTHKNVENLIEAVKIFDRHDIKFVLTGKNNDYYNALKLKAKNYNLENIIFLNYISDELLNGLYKNAIANIYLSIYEGFGFPPMEAASHGTISIISDIPVMREIYGNSMCFVNSLDVTQIADAIKTNIENPILKEQFKEQTEFLFEKYSWKKTTNEILNLINTLNHV